MPRIDVIYLGRTLGNADGWDGDPGETFWFYDFKPNPGIDLPECVLSIDTLKGLIGAQDQETGEFVSSQDVVELLSKIPCNE